MLTSLIQESKGLNGCLSGMKTLTGRRRVEDEEDLLPMGDIFASDVAKILSSKAFRLLDDKTQVLTQPANPFIRTRKTHVLEVASDAIVIADVLGLNVMLAQAIALGHDIGHVPGGHPGEHFMAKHMNNKEFCHEILGTIITQKIERRGKGLNLTFETLEGMLCHSGNKARIGMSQEAWVVRHADKIAYIFADYNDLTKRTDYPIERNLQLLMQEFGRDHRERTTTAMAGLIIESGDMGHVSFEKSECGKKFQELRGEMMKVYVHVTEQNLAPIMEPILNFLGELNIGNPYLAMALMTDKDLIFLAKEKVRNHTHLSKTALVERLPYLRELSLLDLCDPCLDW